MGITRTGLGEPTCLSQPLCLHGYSEVLGKEKNFKGQGTVVGPWQENEGGQGYPDLVQSILDLFLPELSVLLTFF